MRKHSSTSFPNGIPLPRAQVKPMTLATKVLKVKYSLSTTPLRIVFISGIPEPKEGKLKRPHVMMEHRSKMIWKKAIRPRREGEMWGVIDIHLDLYVHISSHIYFESPAMRAAFVLGTVMLQLGAIALFKLRKWIYISEVNSCVLA